MNEYTVSHGVRFLSRKELRSDTVPYEVATERSYRAAHKLKTEQNIAKISRKNCYHCYPPPLNEQTFEIIMNGIIIHQSSNHIAIGPDDMMMR